ncbi:hypothetical protein CVT26_007188 [Gymnopilus dilepis]|uniref:Uncharacterized protein n=1 Tax=Gymnopilus dilepis TaxID=231916 RepID=A0A409W0A9_9AGAR|nr:hypothetical protein CVT26_007188 [Gymnopilus dilepis]
MVNAELCVRLAVARSDLPSPLPLRHWLLYDHAFVLQQDHGALHPLPSSDNITAAQESSIPPPDRGYSTERTNAVAAARDVAGLWRLARRNGGRRGHGKLEQGIGRVIGRVVGRERLGS